MMISYDPLFKTLKEKGLRQVDLMRKCELSSATMSKFRKGESVTLNVIARICTYLQVPVEKVVQINYKKDS